MLVYKYIHNQYKVFEPSETEDGWFSCVHPDQLYIFQKFDATDPKHTTFNKWLDWYKKINPEENDYLERHVSEKFFLRENWRVVNTNEKICCIM